ncbi:hypothetical protein PYCC9005_005270 [Savitreella phatthalungensis]
MTSQSKETDVFATVWQDGTDEGGHRAAELQAYKLALDADAKDEQPVEFIKALNDWRPVKEYLQHGKKRKSGRRKNAGLDEHGHSTIFMLLRFPLLIFIFGWIFALAFFYALTRVYVAAYENFWLWTGEQGRLRDRLRKVNTYEEWKEAALALDISQGHEEWKQDPEYDYYDWRSIRKMARQLRAARAVSDKDELRRLLTDCVKSNFCAVESPRLYSMTYYGTKHLVDIYYDEVEASLKMILEDKDTSCNERALLAKAMSRNYGRTALCLSGGATFAYYHFGVVRALLDQGLLPNVITGTSGGGIVASLCCVYTEEELKTLLVPELCYKITACHEDMKTCVARWWRTGAQFDPADWAERSRPFTRGSTTFKEAFERTGRVLNITCIPNDVHSPPKLINYLTAPDTVIWSALLASAAVPSILPPVPLMQKSSDGRIIPYNFGNKWKDGSIRTDIPVYALNLYFNVTFTIVAQANPHVKLWFFSARGQVGRPTAHRRGRGWRGGFIGSALEQFIKHDLLKWLKVLRDLELLPRPTGTDWSSVFLQKFDGTITIWPQSRLSDFPRILSDPTLERLTHMIRGGQIATFPRLLFIRNRLRLERLLEQGRALSKGKGKQGGSGGLVMSASDVEMSSQHRFDNKGARSSPRRRTHKPARTPAQPDSDGNTTDDGAACFATRPFVPRRASRLGVGDGYLSNDTDTLFSDGGRWSDDNEQDLFL